MEIVNLEYMKYVGHGFHDIRTARFTIPFIMRKDPDFYLFLIEKGFENSDTVALHFPGNGNCYITDCKENKVARVLWK